ncbi:MAG: molybdopterin synthase [Acidimicrobiaceae bacterium]|nr:molybdopterin synthase [Acidimicrobiaceae bacterium]
MPDAPAPIDAPPHSGGPEGDTWVGLSATGLPVAEVERWVVRPDCGAVVVFCGTARNHTGDRGDVTELSFEAYEEQAVPRMSRIVDEARRRWPDLRRVALLHRTGPLAIGDAAVVVATSSPHRDAAYAANRFCIDSLKATVPIWKREAWDGGERWGVDAQHLVEVEGLGTAEAPVAGDPA